MDWFSGIGRRFWQAYQDGLSMSCPAHRLESEEASDSVKPCHIGMRQDDVAIVIQQRSTIRH